MQEVKQRRLLTETDLLQILESNEDELLKCDKGLEDTASQIFDGLYEPGIYSKLIAEGKLEAATVRIKNQPSYVLIYSRNALNWLLIEAAATLGNPAGKLKDLFAGIDAVARHYGCQTVQCVTCLSGMLRFASSVGYTPLGVVICKKNEPA